MSDSPVPGPGASREASPPARRIVWAVLRAAGSTTALVVIYYLLPLERFSAGATVTILVIGLVALIALLTFQVRAILGARFPGLRAVEALATSIPLFLLLVASAYLVIAAQSAGSFSQQLTHTDALYFTVSVFATVGFGDITAKTEAARLVVTGQMIIDLVILGIGARLILGVVQQSRRRRPEDANTPRADE